MVLHFESRLLLLVLLDEPLNQLFVFYPFLVLLFVRLPDPTALAFELLGQTSDLVQVPEPFDVFLKDDFLALGTVLILVLLLFEQNRPHTIFARAVLLGAEDHREPNVIIILFKAEGTLKVG